MLATVAALQLLALSQIVPPREVTPADAVPEEAGPEVWEGVRRPVEVTAPAGALAQENPPLPSKPSPPSAAPSPGPPAETEPPAPPAQAEPAPVAPTPGAAPSLPPPPERTRRPSLLSGEPLRGSSTALAWAGWSSIGIAYGQGITAVDDLGGVVDYDWAKSEFVLALAYRRWIGRAGGWDMASRLSLGWYSNFGSTLIEDDNRSDRGIEVTPGLSVSRSGEAGVFSAMVEGPITVTWKYGAGLLFSPRFTIAFEAPVYHEVTVGFRAGAAYRAGSGDAPLKKGDPEFLFVVLGGYHLL